MAHAETDTLTQIFSATEKIMAREGFHHLSMHKIAKEAKVSPGTIYLYFKNKDELLEQFARRTFNAFLCVIAKNADETLSFFEQYRQMWWNVWHYLCDNPMVLANVNQYRSLPDFSDICAEAQGTTYWDLFCQKAQSAGVLCDLPSKILFSLGLATAINLAVDQAAFKQLWSNEILENVIERTWRSIQK
ncbi:TetR family transcriptional regulator [Pasteurellaceae bacterium Pebbles2]|nr:TetR family transcriptional regulator [Pasteurellaceae bacterium Pebbles2]